MAKSQNDLIYDEALNYIRARGSKITVCNGQPTTYVQATTTSNNMLAETTTGITSGEYTGPANGDVSGRKVTTPAKNDLSVLVSANANHVAVVSTSGSALLYVTTVTSQALTTGNTVNVAAFDFEIEDVA